MYHRALFCNFKLCTVSLKSGLPELRYILTKGAFNFKYIIVVANSSCFNNASVRFKKIEICICINKSRKILSKKS